MVATTLLGRPKVVHFALQTAYGAKQFDVDVHRRNFDLVWATTSTDDAPKHKGHDLFRVRDLSAAVPLNRSLWAKGDLNPHVPKDTGT